MKAKTKILAYSSLLAITLGAGVSSCTNLDEEVYSEVLASSFKPTERDLPYILAPIYAPFRTSMLGWHGYFDLQEESADVIVTPVRPNGWDDGGTYRRMHQHNWTSEQSQPNGAWNIAFSSISRCNMTIMQIEDGTLTLPDDVAAAAIVELRAVRALAYYILLDNHGNVPIVTDYRDSSLPEQSTRQEVYDFVLSELAAVLPSLTEEVSPNTYGRMTKWAAKALLAKIYLNAEVYTGTPQWDKVIEETDAIIAGGLFSLDANYSDVFTYTNQNSSEIIFAVPYDEIYGQGASLHMKTLDPLSRLVYGMSAGPWGGNCAVPQFIDTYDPDDTRMKDTWIQGPQYNASTGEEVINYVKAVSEIARDGGVPSNAGYRVGKYKIKQGATSNLDNDFPMFRYGDVLMMKAEALLRKGDADGAAVLVTEVRRRAFKDNPEKAVVTGADLLKGSVYQYGWQNPDGTVDEVNGGADIKFGAFLDELGWEFAAEARRRQDLIRFGVFQTKSWFNHRPHAEAQNRTLFPIPFAELSKNPNLTQNPGYN